MKILKLICIILLTGAAIQAATMTVEVPDAQVPRILEAYGSIYNLGRNATPAEVQVMIQGWLQSSTQDYERRKNMAQFTVPPVYSPTPTPTPGGMAAVVKTNGAFSGDASLTYKTATPTATPKKKK